MKVVSPIRERKQIEMLKAYLKSKSIRNYLYFMVGISSALRCGDILQLKVLDIWDGKKPQEFIALNEEKTKKYKKFPVTENLAKAIKEYIKEYKPELDDFVFISRKGNKHISRQQASLILQEAGDMCSVPNLNNHSLRKTWAYWAFKQGISMTLISHCLNHSSEYQSRKYIGLLQEELDEVYINLNL